MNIVLRYFIFIVITLNFFSCNNYNEYRVYDLGYFVSHTIINQSELDLIAIFSVEEFSDNIYWETNEFITNQSKTEIYYQSYFCPGVAESNMRTPVLDPYINNLMLFLEITNSNSILTQIMVYSNANSNIPWIRHNSYTNDFILTITNTDLIID